MAVLFVDQHKHKLISYTLYVNELTFQGMLVNIEVWNLKEIANIIY